MRGALHSLQQASMCLIIPNPIPHFKKYIARIQKQIGFETINQRLAVAGLVRKLDLKRLML
jgi:hypothetical protein